MALNATDGLRPSLADRIAWRLRHRTLAIRWRRFWASDRGRTVEWGIAALMAAGVVFGAIQLIVERLSK